MELIYEATDEKDVNAVAALKKLFIAINEICSYVLYRVLII
jgi:hypothetical protein